MKTSQSILPAIFITTFKAICIMFTLSTNNEKFHLEYHVKQYYQIYEIWFLRISFHKLIG